MDALANLGAEKFTVALETDFSAAQQVGHRRNGFLGVLGAGTDSDNKIAK